MARRRITKAAKQSWVLYARKSTDDPKKQQMSLPDQITKGRDGYASLPEEDRRGHPLKILDPESKSGFHPNNRPVFTELLQMAEKGEVYGVLAAQFNRISRNPGDTGAFLQHMKNGEIRSFVATVGGRRYSGDNSSDLFMLAVEGGMGCKDSQDKGDLIRDRMTVRASEGKRMGWAANGFKNFTMPDGTKTVQLDPEKAPRILRMFQIADTGVYSLAHLATEAQKIGLLTRNGKQYSPQSMQKMLENPVYKGITRFNGVTAHANHPAIVSDSLWDHVQLVLERRGKPSAKPKNLSLRDLFVFGSMLQCPKCGRHLSPYRVQKPEKNRQYIYYDCMNRQKKCRVRVKQSKIVNQLEPLLVDAALTEDYLKGLRGDLLNEHRRRSTAEIEERRGLNTEYESVQTQIVDVFSQLKEAERMGIRGEIEKHLQALTDRRDKLQGQLNMSHAEGTAWIEEVIRCFELFELLREAAICGSAPVRQVTLTAMTSNLSVDGERLVCKLRSPLQQSSERHGCKDWWS